MKHSSVGLLTGFLLGLAAAAAINFFVIQPQHNELRDKQQRVVDSLQQVNLALKDSLTVQEKATTKEIIKYYEIKPKSNSVPYIDSLLRARFE